MSLDRRAAALLLAFPVTLTGLHRAQSVQVSGPLARGNLYRGTAALTLDGQHVIFAGHYKSDSVNVNSLYCAPSDGSAGPLLLYDQNGFGEGREFDPGTVTFLDLTADSRRALFTVDERGTLFAVPIDGASPYQGIAQADTDVPFQVSADGTRAVFTLRGGWPDYSPALRSVRTDGSEAAIELVAADPQAHVLEYAIEAGSQRVVFLRGDADGLAPRELFSIPIDGSAPAVRLSPRHLGDPGGTGPRTASFQIAPDGQHVVFLVEQEGAPNRLYSVATDGHEPARVLAANVRGPFLFTPRSDRVVHRALRPGGVTGLFVQSLVGGAPTLLHEPADTLDRLELAGSGVLFVDVPPGSGERLFRVALTGATPARALSARLPVGRSLREFHASPDGVRVVYSADAEVAGVFTLFSAPLTPHDGPLAGDPDVPFPLDRTADVERFVFLPDSSAVLAHVAGPGGPFLDRVPVDGGPVRRLGGPEGVSELLIDAVGTRAVYRGSREHDTRPHVYSVALEGDAPRVQLDDFGPVLGAIRSYEIHPSGREAVYTAGSRDYSFPEFHCVPLDLSGPPRLLEGLLVGEEYLVVHHVDAGSDRVVYMTQTFNVTDGAHRHLYSAPLDGHLGRTRLDEVEPGQHDFGLAGGRVLYLADSDSQPPHDRHELFSVPVDGSSGPVVLNGALPVAGGAVHEYAVSRDQGRVLYVASQNISNRRELFSVPVDGSLPAVQLSPPAVVGAAVGTLRFTADGTRVAFRGDLTLNDAFGLWIAPLDGGTPALELFRPGGNREVTAYELTPDSTRAVFTADVSTNGRHLLHVVSLDGSSPPVALPSTPGQPDVLAFHLTPDGTRAVHHLATGQLYSVRVDGSAPPVALSPGLPGNTFTFQVTDTWVVYRADHELAHRLDLHVVPVDGSAPPRRLNSAVDSDHIDITYEVAGDDVIYTAPLASIPYPHPTALFRAPLSGSSPPRRISPQGTWITPWWWVPPFAVTPDDRGILFHATSDAGALYLHLSGPKARNATTR